MGDERKGFVIDRNRFDDDMNRFGDVRKEFC